MRRTRKPSAFFARVIRGFEVRSDLFEREPGRLEFTARVEGRLVHVVSTLRIAAGAKRVDREGTNFWRKLDHADIRSAGNTVAAFLSFDLRGVQREDSAIVTIHAANSETRLRVLKVFVPAFVNTLQARDFAPLNSPRSKVALQ